ncbi:hypothetical protein QTL97_12000 [Sporosarcina thermotolerans]|uniref:Uncharacterized protein n=1 Tax=Sporosarcina thermotolerans TaxID=633404 RepID=A0AAW9A8C4_9BACL|nr:hypothetical protein [Sporosarcina thermotolerans]MDW0117662.1 hypothetical protein [Sporosarcina thermotolerans]WHT49246.1 hypothetical protein QNH10_06405 [Sporosarcina thermotolerans]
MLEGIGAFLIGKVVIGHFRRVIGQFPGVIGHFPKVIGQINGYIVVSLP